MNRWLWAALAMCAADPALKITVGARLDNWVFLAIGCAAFLLIAAGSPAVRLSAVTAGLVLGGLAVMLYAPPGQPAHVIWGPLGGTHHHARLSGGK